MMGLFIWTFFRPSGSVTRVISPIPSGFACTQSAASSLSSRTMNVSVPSHSSKVADRSSFSVILDPGLLFQGVSV